MNNNSPANHLILNKGSRLGQQDLSGQLHHESILADEDDEPVGPTSGWPTAPPKERSNGASDSHLKPKSLVDKIQSDFPRTPSPIYQKTKSEEALLVNANSTSLPNNRIMLQPQPQHAISQLLQQATHNNYQSSANRKDLHSFYDPTAELAESVGDMYIYNDKNKYYCYANYKNKYNDGYDKRQQYLGRDKMDNQKDEYDQPLRSNDNRHQQQYSGYPGVMGGYYGNVPGYNQQTSHPFMSNMLPNSNNSFNNSFNQDRRKGQQPQQQMYAGAGLQLNDYYNNTWSDAPSTNERNDRKFNYNQGYNQQGREQDSSPPGRGNGRMDSRSYTSSSHSRNGNGYYSSTPSSPKDSSSNSNRSSLLEEFRMNKNRKWELQDIMGHVVEFSGDQHGSRFIQQKLESCSEYDKEMVFNEILPHAMQLMVDVFGNYVIQKFFEYGTHQQKLVLSERVMGHVLSLSLQMYGCRVIQKAIEGVDREQHCWIAKELEGNIMKCVKDQNGNHVIQKCIERMPADLIQFIIDSFHGEVYQLATHSYGCRVVQRILEHAEDSQRDPIMDELMRFCPSLVQDKYGNYVIQHVLEHGKIKDKSTIISKMRGQIVQLSQHKFASNVIEKCVQYGTPKERLLILEEINSPTANVLPDSALVVMMRDQFANYVIQKIIDVVDDNQREILIQKIRPHLPALKKCTYSKHIVSHVEKLLNK